MASALTVAVLAYVAWIPAEADNAHPELATVTGMVSLGALLVFLGLAAASIRAVWKRHRSK